MREREAFGGRRNEEQAESSQAGVEVIGQEEEVKPMPRVSEADKTGDVRSLDRNGERNLYLLLRVKDGENSVWRFPQGGIQEGELLHEVCILFLSCVFMIYEVLLYRPHTVTSSRNVALAWTHGLSAESPLGCISLP